MGYLTVNCNVYKKICKRNFYHLIGKSSISHVSIDFACSGKNLATILLTTPQYYQQVVNENKTTSIKMWDVFSLSSFNLENPVPPFPIYEVMIV